MMIPRALLALGLMTGAMSVVAQHAPHQHGVAELRVAVDGRQMTIELDSPLDNLVGFERAPRTAREREALTAAAARLRDVARLFELPAGAGCVAGPVEVEMPYAAASTASDEVHSDAHAVYMFDCDAPAQLVSVRSRLAEAFPRLKRVQVDIVTAAGQRRLTLSGAQRDLPL